MDSYHKRKTVLEEKYGKLINLKPFNDDIGTVITHNRNSLNNFKILQMRRDLNEHMTQNMVSSAF